MMLHSKKMGIAIAPEATYGTDAVPTAALNAILAENVKLVPIDGDEITFEHIRPGGFGGFEKTLLNKRVQLDFDVRLRASGAAGNAPAIGTLLRSVGFAELLSAGVSATYKLVSRNFESSTVYLFRGDSANGIRHRLLGVRGSWKLSIDPKNHMMISFSLQGLYVDPNSQAMPVNFDFSAFTNTPIVPVSKINTTFTLGGYAAIVEKMDIDSGLAATHRPLINYESIDITDRNVAGSIVIQEPDLAVKDYLTTAYAAPEVLAFQNGLIAGQIIKIDAARVQRSKADLADSGGISTLSIPISFLPSDAGDDNDIILTFQ